MKICISCMFALAPQNLKPSIRIHIKISIEKGKEKLKVQRGKEAFIFLTRLRADSFAVAIWIIRLPCFSGRLQIHGEQAAAGGAYIREVSVRAAHQPARHIKGNKDHRGLVSIIIRLKQNSTHVRRQDWHGVDLSCRQNATPCESSASLSISPRRMPPCFFLPFTGCLFQSVKQCT